jgi:hypothetical protein
MLGFNVVAFFCEDIREERMGSETLIGILPDNIAVSSVPGMMPKLCVYVRTNFDSEYDLPPGSVIIRFPHGEDVTLGEITQDLIKTAREKTILDGGRLVGIKTRAAMANVIVKTAGRIQAIAKLGDREQLIASLNINVEPSTAAGAIEDDSRGALAKR